MAGLRALNEYPFQDGDTVVLGPEVFVSSDGTVICFRGENYYRGPGAAGEERLGNIWDAYQALSYERRQFFCAEFPDVSQAISDAALAPSPPGPLDAGLTPEEAYVLVHGVVGPDGTPEEVLDAAEALHDQAMAKLRALAASPREDGER